MKKTKRFAITISALMLAFAGLVGCSSDSGEEAIDCTEPILIGAAMAQTGFMSPFDGPALATAQIAVDKINAEGGVNGCQLVLEAVDTETNPDKGQQIATDLIAKGAKMLLVTCDYDINAKSSQVANDAGVLVVAPCVGSTAMGPDNGLDLGYSMGSAVPGEAAIMAEYAFENLGQTVTLFKDMSIAYTTSQCDAFETRYTELGGTVKSVQQFTQTQAGALDKPVTADVIALCSYPGGGAQALAAIRNGGLNTPVISGFGMDGAFWLGAVPDLSNFYTVTYASVFGDDPNQKVVDLLAAFKEKTGQDAATGGLITGASTIEAFKLAAERAGSFDGAALSAEFNKFQDEDLTAGPTSFSPDLHVNVKRPMAVITVNGGKHQFVEYRAAEKPVL
jgi:branched-chain amino acid transport system substrate-binding protein